MEKMGKYAFIAGLIICALAGFGLEATWVPWVLAALGLVVGFLNIGDKEVSTFLLASIALIMSASAMAMLPFVGGVLTTILAYLIVFIAPAVLVVSLKGLLAVAKD
jgi:ATP synthase protein I